MKMYRGIIVDNNHPDKNGQCKVKLYDFHTSDEDGDDFNKVTPDSLPWAEVMGSVELGLNSGVGLSTVPRQGTMVWCVLDNDDPNKPIIVGTSTGTPTINASEDKTGFSDPDNVYPKPERLGQPDTSPVVRDESTPSEYTEISVLETQSGHVIEIDDTVGNSRIKITASSGVTIELSPNGKIIMFAPNDIDITTETKLNVLASSDINMTTQAKLAISASSDISIAAGGNFNMSSGGAMTLGAGGALTLAGSPININ